MERVKIFGESTTWSEGAKQLEQAINTWLFENPSITITRVTQSESKSYESLCRLHILIFYEYPDDGSV